MRWGPQEDQREEHERKPADVSRHRGPADQGWKRAGGSTDDDIERRSALQQHRVDEDVEQAARECQRGGQRVHGEAEDEDRRGDQGDAEGQRLPRKDPPGRQRAAARPRHDAVDVAVIPAIDCARAPGCERTAERGPEEQRERGDATGGDDHGRNFSDEQQHDDPRLGQADVVTSGGADLRRACASSAGRGDGIRWAQDDVCAGLHCLSYALPVFAGPSSFAISALKSAELMVPSAPSTTSPTFPLVSRKTNAGADGIR